MKAAALARVGRDHSPNETRSQEPPPGPSRRRSPSAAHRSKPIRPHIARSDRRCPGHRQIAARKPKGYGCLKGNRARWRGPAGRIQLSSRHLTAAGWRFGSGPLSTAPRTPLAGPMEIAYLRRDAPNYWYQVKNRTGSLNRHCTVATRHGWHSSKLTCSTTDPRQRLHCIAYRRTRAEHLCSIPYPAVPDRYRSQPCSARSKYWRRR